jgi:hypothetical protein
MTELLPLELLQHIFLLGEHPELPNDDETRGPLIYPPLLVSKRWRAAALSFPDIWTHILLDESNASGSRSMPVAVLEDWIARSGGRHLEVSLHWNYSYYSEKDLRDEWIRILTLHISRWSKLSCELGWNDFNKLISPHLSKARALRELRMQGYHSGSEIDDRPLNQFAPCLRRLDLGNCAYIHELHRMGGDSVRILNLSDTPFEPFELEILSKEMPNICELGLYNCSWMDHVDHEHPAALFHNVEHLSYTNDRHDSDLFSCIVQGATRMTHIFLRDRMSDEKYGLLSEEVLANLPSTLQSLRILVSVEDDDSFKRKHIVVARSVIGSWIMHLGKLETYEVEFVFPDSTSTG